MTSSIYGGSDLPPKIQRAIARAMDPQFPVELGSSERVAFATLLRRVEAQTGAGDFWVKRCNMAELFGKVERTITNWLSVLEDKGLIKKEQGRTRWGCYSSLTLQLTAQAIQLLGLNEEFSSSRKKISPRYMSCSTEGEQSQERHCPAASPDAESYPQADFVVLPGGFKIPGDCAPLIEAGISPSGIFKLMKVSRLMGHKLGTIVEAKKASIAAAKNPFAFVMGLAKQKVDYVAELQRVNAKAAEESKPVQKNGLRELLKEIFPSLSGRLIEVSEGKVVKVDVASDAPPQVYKSENGRLEYAYPIVGPALFRFWKDMKARVDAGTIKFHQVAITTGRRPLSR